MKTAGGQPRSSTRRLPLTDRLSHVLAQARSGWNSLAGAAQSGAITLGNTWAVPRNVHRDFITDPAILCLRT